MERPHKRSRVPDQPSSEPDLGISLPSGTAAWTDWKLKTARVFTTAVEKQADTIVCARVDANLVLVARGNIAPKGCVSRDTKHETADEVAKFFFGYLNTKDVVFYDNARWTNAPFSKDSCDYNQHTLWFDCIKETSIDVSGFIATLLSLNEGKCMPGHRFVRVFVYPGRLAIECEAVSLAIRSQDT
jgi:hypothetical protein